MIKIKTSMWNAYQYNPRDVQRANRLLRDRETYPTHISSVSGVTAAASEMFDALPNRLAISLLLLQRDTSKQLLESASLPWNWNVVEKIISSIQLGGELTTAEGRRRSMLFVG